jgi:hypothetical protein
LTLLERVVARSFRPVRYAELLRDDDLPEQVPERFDDEHGRGRKIWAELLNLRRSGTA